MQKIINNKFTPNNEPAQLKHIVDFENFDFYFFSMITKFLWSENCRIRFSEKNWPDKVVSDRENFEHR